VQRLNLNTSTYYSKWLEVQEVLNVIDEPVILCKAEVLCDAGNKSSNEVILSKYVTGTDTIESLASSNDLRNGSIFTTAIAR
jgi:hypothetical protein